MNKIEFEPKTTRIEIDGIGNKNGYLYYNHDTDTLQMGILKNGEEVEFLVNLKAKENGLLEILKNIGL